MLNHRIVEVTNNCTSDDTGEMFGIRETGLLYGGNRFLKVTGDGFTVYLIDADKLEKTDDSPCIMQIHLPYVLYPERENIDLLKIAEMSVLDFFDYISSLEVAERNRRRW